MSVTVSCVWTVLHLPARLQDVFQAGSPRMFAWAMLSGLALASVAMTPGIGAPLPTWVGGAGMLLSGIFVGMLASALEKILEVAPVLLRRAVYTAVFCGRHSGSRPGNAGGGAGMYAVPALSKGGQSYGKSIRRSNLYAGDAAASR